MSRPALLWALCGLSVLVSAGARAGSWSDLWLTPDQQGQRLLDAGHPAQAAHRFEDPRRRAYADLKARRYAAAAKLLAPFKDPESEYNRGNALARSGRLRAALDAYDAALKHAPADRDIRHNRDLVARALRKRRKKQPEQGAAAGQRHRNQTQAKPSRSHGGGRQHTGRGTGTGGRGQTARPRSKQAGRQTGAGAQQAQAQERQAKRDAAATARLRRGRAKPGSNDRSGSPRSAAASKGRGSKPPAPPTERALSLDQWLRRIPDNPAGLLRRKFLIENALRAQQGRQR